MGSVYAWPILSLLVVNANGVVGSLVVVVEETQRRSYTVPVSEVELHFFFLLVRDCLELGLQVLAHPTGNEPVHESLASACRQDFVR